MKTLGGSYLKLFTRTHGEKDSFFWRSREIALSGQKSGFLGHQKRVIDGLSLAVSSQQKHIHPISEASSSQTNLGSEETQTIYSDQLKTVRVRFKLQKECAFGQQFVIVGDDPIVGLWEPSDGVALNWSEGHVWTAEMDIPIGKVIKYKLILKEQTGNISWQPGPDRVLETWETNKTITVIEDWHNEELQNIIEEDFVADINEESLIGSDSLLVTENLNLPVVNDETEVIKKLADANGPTNMVAENINEEFHEQDSSLGDKGSGLMSVTDQKMEERTLEDNGSKLLSSKDEIRLVEDEEGVPVLVPGLAPIPVEEIEAAETSQEESISIDNTDEIEDSSEPELKDEKVSASVHSTERTKLKDENVPASTESNPTNTPLKDEHVSGLLHSAETSETKIDEKQHVYGTEKVESDIFKSDMQWGRRTLQKFLANLGFQ